MPVAQRTNKKEELLEAAVRLVAAGGTAAATVRAIASEAGVTEGAVYRHFRSKSELCSRAYARIIEDLVRSKQHLVTSELPLQHKLREWVRLSYEYYDRNPDAFAYVLLTPHLVSKPGELAATGQGELFIQLIERASARNEIRAIKPTLALSHFVGLLLNVPRMINESALAPPASQFVDDVAEAAWRMFRRDADDDEAPKEGESPG